MALGIILKIDNLRKSIIVVNRCCMPKRDGETIDRLLLHCPIARELWNMVFSLFGVHLVMLKRVIDMLAY